LLPLEGNDRRLSSSSKGRVRENFLINQQMSTFTSEILIEPTESASLPRLRCRSTTPRVPIDYDTIPMTIPEYAYIDFV
jgi:hypothetical protein